MEQIIKTYPGKYVAKCYIDNGIVTTIYIVVEESGIIYEDVYIDDKIVTRKPILDLN